MICNYYWVTVTNMHIYSLVWQKTTRLGYPVWMELTMVYLINLVAISPWLIAIYKT